MGGGTDYGRITPRARAMSMLTAVRAAEDAVGDIAPGGAAGAAGFCSSRHAVTFAVPADTALPSTGEPVTVIASHDALRIESRSGVLGTLRGPFAKALLGCVAMGFVLAGHVTEVDESIVHVQILGDRPAAA